MTLCLMVIPASGARLESTLEFLGRLPPFAFRLPPFAFVSHIPNRPSDISFPHAHPDPHPSEPGLVAERVDGVHARGGGRRAPHHPLGPPPAPWPSPLRPGVDPLPRGGSVPRRAPLVGHREDAPQAQAEEAQDRAPHRDEGVRHAEAGRGRGDTRRLHGLLPVPRGGRRRHLLPRRGEPRAPPRGRDADLRRDRGDDPLGAPPRALPLLHLGGGRHGRKVP